MPDPKSDPMPPRHSNGDRGMSPWNEDGEKVSGADDEKVSGADADDEAFDVEIDIDNKE